MIAPGIAIATNNGDIGGGEVMLLSIAHALRDLGIRPVVLAPTDPGDVLVAAMSEEFETVALPATGRRRYMAALAAWRIRHPRIPLWCNGLVPSTATAGMGPRIVHLHMEPRPAHRAALTAARMGGRVVVPSEHVARAVPGSVVLSNWTQDITFAPRPLPGRGPLTVGYMGRLTLDKGVDVLARAMRTVVEQSGRDVRLLVAGESRFGASGDDGLIEAALSGLNDRLELRGWVQREDFLRDVDLVVFPSVASESFGLVAAEAMAAGVPVVVSDAGALPEVVGPDHPWIARRGDPDHLAETIEAALSLSGEGRAATTLAARRRWESRYSPQAGIRGVAALLQLLAQSPGPSATRSPGRGPQPS